VTIRVLGGLLAAFHLTNDDMFLDKATDLGARLCGAFGSSSAIPMASVNLKTREGVVAHFNAGASSTSEATTIQLEFKFLSHLTGDPTYWDLANNVISHINTLPSEDGLVPVFIRFADNAAEHSKFFYNLLALTMASFGGARSSWARAVTATMSTC